MVGRRTFVLFASTLLVLCLPPGTRLGGEQSSTLERSWKDHLATICPGPGEPASIGSYAIRVYSKSIDDFTVGAVWRREGTIVDAWILDLDGNASPEIVVWTRSAGSGSYGRVDLFTLESDRLRSLDLPEPDSTVLSGYRGHDRFAITQNRIQRSFPIYSADDRAALPSGGTRHLLYDFQNRRWNDRPGTQP